MKTTNTAISPLHRLWLPRFSWEGVRWKVRGAVGAGRSGTARLGVLSLRVSLALLLTLGFLIAAVFAVADAMLTRIVAVPTAAAMAHARAKWLHRWSRVARWVLGVRIEQRGVMPASGIITANYSGFLDAILLAAVRPCVFVAGAEVRRWPVIGTLARLGGTIFVDPRRRDDVARVNFLIERALRRRLLVVIFPECGATGRAGLRPFASALFQAAVELGCSLTGAAFTYHTPRKGAYTRMRISHQGGFLRQFTQIVSRWRTRAICAFCSPAFHHGNRKQLADQLRMETLDLMLRIATPGERASRNSSAETGMSKRTQLLVITTGRGNIDSTARDETRHLLRQSVTTLGN